MKITLNIQISTGIIFVLLSSSILAYNRSDYPHWIDADNDGQDTRQEILIRDSKIDVTYKPNGDVESGLWVCPYTGRTITNSSDLDVDHLVALGEIDAAGAIDWPVEKRTAIANDPDNLVAVQNGSNRSKGDRDAYLWLPPNIANCTWYLEERSKVWDKYDMQMDNDEKASVKFFMNKCPKHEKGIKLNRVRRWLGTWFDGLF